ncbi:MAG: hypothetical protein UY97_C0003G0015 [Parcubacteria group bacterium GW2011_GWB1_57_6]|nr:MAG: hypothetical protein UY93_C0002G0207 [Parcubacteria group bacterium GW2011_GWA1_56_13]KKW46741.1 MAG: hypothetical protein UY97_C0003G0015 [Parcubacteria group bacterium GW2011_GWB1_57_6]
MAKTVSIILILVFGAFFLYALADGNLTGSIATGVVFFAVCFLQAFVLVPRLRRWNAR